MDDFAKLVKRCADNLENHTIFNASVSHAIILFKNLLEVALRKTEEVRIFSGCFDAAVYNSLVDVVSAALNKGVRVTLLSECAEDKLHGNAFVQAVSNHQNGMVRALNEVMGFPHFILIGNSRYRVELDDALKTARANFNDPVTGNTLQTIYNELISKPIAVA